MDSGLRVPPGFFQRDALELAPEVLAMKLVRKFEDGSILSLDITDVEVYRGEEDMGCHARKGRTPRTEVMYQPGGKLYVYLIYGMYWLLNITTGPADHPQAILVRGTREVDGPGRVGRALKLDKSFYGEDIYASNRLWLEWRGDAKGLKHLTRPRVGIDYAGDHWANINWRYIKGQ